MLIPVMERIVIECMIWKLIKCLYRMAMVLCKKLSC